MEFFRYLFFGTGALLSPVVQMAIFASTALLDRHGVPLKERQPDRGTVPDIEILPVARANGLAQEDRTRGGFTLLTVLLTPESRGTFRLRNTDPRASPRIDLNYLSVPHDRTRVRHATGHAYRREAACTGLRDGAC